MREEDRDEIWKSSRLQPLEALLLGQMDSLRTWTFLVRGRVVAIFGVAPLTDMVGAPWMLASLSFRKPARHSWLTAGTTSTKCTNSVRSS